VDDAAYARAFARGRFLGRGYGPQRLRADLLKRGIARETIEAALADLVESVDLDESALRLARPKWASLAREPDVRKRQKKTMDFLLRRGYAFDTARETVDVLMREDPSAPDSPDDA
jgi:regulatory protein